MHEGADRLELCADLTVGGVTPSAALRRHAMSLGVPCVAMARPGGGSFILDAAAVDATVADAERQLDDGVAGVVFGGLSDDGRVHRRLVQRIVAVAGGRDTVFHRAFDDTPDRLEALDTLMDLGVTRILTAGGPLRAIDSAAQIAALVHRARGRIEVLAGGGVRAENARQLLAATGVEQLHARASDAGVMAALRAAITA